MDATITTLGDDDLDRDPLRQFGAWYSDALASGEDDAVALATVGEDGSPSVRYVLLKGFGANGFVFYTNWHSRKGRDIAANPHVALAFRWRALERQVRVSGKAERISPEDSDAYFSTRPRPAQLGAWASAQSEPIAGRAELDEHLEVVTARFAGRDVPRPPWWGGYRVAPTEFDFWLGHRDRLHDRFQYQLAAEGWTLRRLNP